MDGFDDDEAEGECDEGSEVLVGFLAAERNALEALELADELFDAGASPVKGSRNESRPVLGRCLDRDHRADATVPRRRAIALAVVPFVAHRSPRRDVGSEIEQNLELRAVAGLPLCEVKREWPSIEISLAAITLLFAAFHAELNLTDAMRKHTPIMPATADSPRS